jgi:putative transposase
MKYNPEIHHRRSIRLKGYDYSQEGFYFVTVCTQSKRCLLGRIEKEQMVLNDAGKMIECQWNELVKRFTQIELDEYVVMPNHFHGIVIVGAGLVPARNGAANGITDGATTRVAPTTGTTTVGDIIGAFKSITTHEYINNVKTNNWPTFDGKLWQRNCFEHIIRNEKSLNQIREYIVKNPVKWQQDDLFV